MQTGDVYLWWGRHLKKPLKHKRLMKRAYWHCLFWLLVVLAGSGYALAGYATFSRFLSHDRYSGVMTTAFLVGVPFSTCALISYYLSLKRQASLKKVALTCLGSLFLAIFLCFAIFREGGICILLFLGIAVLPGVLGVVLGTAMATVWRNAHRTLMSVVAILPLAFGGVEQQVPPQDVFHETDRSVFIKAPPEVVWRNILHPTNIRPGELAEGYAYKIGVPYPVEATVVEPKVGGIRKSTWQRGVHFDEEITALKKDRYIEWIYHFTDASFPPGSLDDHVKVGGTYFDLTDTSYTLRPADGGTYLDLSVRYRVTTTFNWYAVPVARFFIGDTASTLLHFYKERSERRTS